MLGCRLVLALLAVVGATSLAVPLSVELAARLPGIFDPLEAASPPAPLRILARDGTLLREFALPGRPPHGATVRWDDVPPILVRALLAGEDRRFFEHSGVDWRAVARATWQNLAAGRIRSGASTLTMQLARLLRFPGGTRSPLRKWRQAVLARRLELLHGKRRILEAYLNRACFGRGLCSLAAAAEGYFGKPVGALTAAEATLLAVLPRAPERYDLRRHLRRAMRRRDVVLDRMQRLGWLTAPRRREIERQPIVLRSPPLRPHDALQASFFVLDVLPEAVRTAARAVRTTLDPSLQSELERLVPEYLRENRDTGLNQAAVVVLDPRDGSIRSWVGSGGRNTAHGWIDFVTRRRPPGSVLKPFFYALAIERGASPATTVFDVADAPGLPPWRARPPPEHGLVTYREALAGSYNIAAMLVVRRIGLGRAAAFLRNHGIARLPRHDADYGLRLALGAGWARLLDVTAAFSAFVRGGRAPWPRLIQGVELADGDRWAPRRRPVRRMFSPQTAWMVMDVLADREARHLVFGRDNPFELPFLVAVKTGTAGGFSDTWTVAATEQAVVGVWAGRSDGQSVHGYLAMDLAAPLAERVLWALRRRGPLTLPPRPPGLRRVTVCSLSGLRPTDACPHQRLEWFREGTTPSTPCNLHERDASGRVRVRWPPQLRGWLRRRTPP